MKNFYIADTHFGHSNIITYDGRPFKDVQEMEEKLIENWNSVVTKEDKVYIVGDFVFLGKQYSEGDKSKKLNWLYSHLNGHKFIVFGNHDEKGIYSKVRGVTTLGDYAEITDGHEKVVLCHYPILFYKRSYNENQYMICGHVHIKNEAIQLENAIKVLKDEWQPDLHMNRGQIFNVGCMKEYMNYTPKTLKQLKESLL